MNVFSATGPHISTHSYIQEHVTVWKF